MKINIKSITRKYISLNPPPLTFGCDDNNNTEYRILILTNYRDILLKFREHHCTTYIKTLVYKLPYIHHYFKY